MLSRFLFNQLRYKFKYNVRHLCQQSATAYSFIPDREDAAKTVNDKILACRNVKELVNIYELNGTKYNKVNAATTLRQMSNIQRNGDINNKALEVINGCFKHVSRMGPVHLIDVMLSMTKLSLNNDSIMDELSSHACVNLSSFTPSLLIKFIYSASYASTKQLAIYEAASTVIVSYINDAKPNELVKVLRSYNHIQYHNEYLYDVVIDKLDVSMSELNTDTLRSLLLTWNKLPITYTSKTGLRPFQNNLFTSTVSRLDEFEPEDVVQILLSISYSKEFKGYHLPTLPNVIHKLSSSSPKTVSNFLNHIIKIDSKERTNVNLEDILKYFERDVSRYDPHQIATVMFVMGREKIIKKELFQRVSEVITNGIFGVELFDLTRILLTLQQAQLYSPSMYQAASVVLSASLSDLQISKSCKELSFITHAYCQAPSSDFTTKLLKDITNKILNEKDFKLLPMNIIDNLRSILIALSKVSNKHKLHKPDLFKCIEKALIVRIRELENTELTALKSLIKKHYPSDTFKESVSILNKIEEVERSKYVPKTQIMQQPKGSETKDPIDTMIFFNELSKEGTISSRLFRICERKDDISDLMRKRELAKIYNELISLESSSIDISDILCVSEYCIYKNRYKSENEDIIILLEDTLKISCRKLRGKVETANINFIVLLLKIWKPSISTWPDYVINLYHEISHKLTAMGKKAELNYNDKEVMIEFGIRKDGSINDLSSLISPYAWLYQQGLCRRKVIISLGHLILSGCLHDTGELKNNIEVICAAVQNDHFLSNLAKEHMGITDKHTNINTSKDIEYRREIMKLENVHRKLTKDPIVIEKLKIVWNLVPTSLNVYGNGKDKSKLSFLWLLTRAKYLKPTVRLEIFSQILQHTSWR